MCQSPEQLRHDTGYHPERADHYISALLLLQYPQPADEYRHGHDRLQDIQTGHGSGRGQLADSETYFR